MLVVGVLIPTSRDRTDTYGEASGVLAEMCCPVVGGVSMSVPAGPRGPVFNRNRNQAARGQLGDTSVVT